MSNNHSHTIYKIASIQLKTSKSTSLTRATKWQHVRIKSGWDNKQKNRIPDVLRHTFASYHLAKFRNRQHLQEEMGHSSPQLINTTYVALDTLTKNRVKIFWH